MKKGSDYIKPSSNWSKCPNKSCQCAKEIMMITLLLCSSYFVMSLVTTVYTSAAAMLKTW